MCFFAFECKELKNADAGQGTSSKGGRVKVFDGQGIRQNQVVVLHNFRTFPEFKGGVYVASADLTGDGRADVIAARGARKGTGELRVFDARNANQVLQAFPFQFPVSVRVGTGDVNGDGVADLITGAGSDTSGGLVKAFNGRNGNELFSIGAYANVPSGVFVARAPVIASGTGAARTTIANSNGHSLSTSEARKVQQLAPPAETFGARNVTLSQLGNDQFLKERLRKSLAFAIRHA